MNAMFRSAVMIALAMLCPSVLEAQDALARRIDQEIAKVVPAVTEIRHQIHQHPELSNREQKTSALVADYLRKIGLEVQTGIAHTGVVALLNTQLRVKARAAGTERL